MEKLSLAEKLAKKSFESDVIQKSWQVHLQMFGPILEPAFADSYQARVHLTAALNHISTRDLKAGLDKLKGLQKYAESDADAAAWLFFMGLVFDMAGAKEAMLDFYQRSMSYKHKFYMPYLKVAKSAYSDGAYDAAEENYVDCINCLKEVGAGAQTTAVLASVYTNLAACLTMMHRFDDASAALNESRQLAPQQPGRAATEAILCAAMGKSDEALALLETVDAETPVIAQSTRDAVEKILAAQNPHFTPVPVEQAQIDAFWAWLAENEAQILEHLQKEEYDAVFAPSQEQLALVFPFVERPLDLAFQRLDDGSYKVLFADFYMVALRDGYAALLAACPAALKARWQFEIVR